MGEENINGQFLSEPKRAGNSRRYRKGFNTTNKVKLTACAKLKSLIESKRMTIHSRPLISELKSFVSSGSGYAAKVGETDDLVMALVLVIRMAMLMQSYDPTLDEVMKDGLDDYLEPMPFIVF